MHWTTRLKQEWLIAYKNPLQDRFGSDFFRTIPKTPGVYRFYGHFAGEDEVLLYVGKAKNLRARIVSYRRAKPDLVSRKVLRLVWHTSRIEFERCPSEREALLRENELLRELKPPYNVVNTSPENYVFLTLGKTENSLKFRMTRDSPESYPVLEGDEQFFGVFKSRGKARDAYGALLRLLWMANTTCDLSRFEVPQILNRYRPPSPYEMTGIDLKWHQLVERLLSGRSRALLREITEVLLNKDIPPFSYRRVQDDIETLSSFFKSHCRKNRKLCLLSNREGSFIAQQEIDDLLVTARYE